MSPRFFLRFPGLLLPVIFGMTQAAAGPLAVPSAPLVDARNYVLIDPASGRILAANDADKRVPPASLTKLMTAYLTFQAIADGRLKLGQVVPVSVAAWKAGGSTMFLQPNLPVTVEDLIQGMVVVSGNDAAVALAETVAGNVSAFVQMMNVEAQRLGMRNSHFDNVDGLPTPTHLLSARDVATLTQAIIDQYPQFLKYFGEKTFSYNKITQNNWNPLVFTDPTVHGMKTGHTDEAGFCLDAMAQRNGRRLVAVVLGSSTRDASASAAHALLDYGYRFFETHRLYAAGQVLDNVKNSWAKPAIIPVGVAVDVWGTQQLGAAALKPTMNIVNPLPLPLKRGDKVGTLALNDGSGSVVPLVVLAPVEKAGWLSHLANVIRAWF